MQSKTIKAILLSIIAVFLFSIMGILVKYAQETIPSIHVVFARSLLSSLLLLPFVLRARPRFGYKHALLSARGIFGFIGLACTFYSVSKLPLVEALLLFQATPIFILPLSAWALKEKSKPIEWLFMLLGFSGVVVVLQPTGDNMHFLAGLIGLCGAFFAAAAYTTVRHLTITERASVIVFYYAGISTIATTPFVVTEWKSPGWLVIIALIGVGVFSTAAQAIMTKAYSLEKARKIAIVNYLGVPLAALWGYLFWNEIPSGNVVLGTVMILGAMALMESVKSPE